MYEVNAVELEIVLRIMKDNKRVFGKGPCLLLETIDRLGSLSKASNELGISYSKAWSIINRAERMLDYPLLDSQIGGLDGGGSDLTPQAVSLIGKYKAFCDEAESNVKEIYNKYFGE